MERPSRKTKTVDYREPNVFDDDEDFACVKAPPSKKPREDVQQQQEHKKSSSKFSSPGNITQSALSQKSRRPLDVKLLERDLEAAITLSRLNNAEEIKDQSPTIRGDVKVQLPVDENTDPSSLLLSNCSVNGTILGLDEITPEKGSSFASRQRETAVEEQRRNLKEDDEDYQPKLTPGSESDEDFSEPGESEDEEFTVKKVSKIKKEKVPKKEKTKSPPAAKKENKPSKAKAVAAGASMPVRSPPAAKPAPKRPAASSAGSTPTPAVPLSPAGGRIPKWNPPGQVGRSPTSYQNSAVKSPGQGLRLGLSRRVRVKPLHPGVASH